uniref:Highly divergent homeobox n=1 Tax=Petromyzon marinus TaxID=7757 RepID=S4RHR1_PETMA
MYRRSVISPEQHQILQHFYDVGMTNQSVQCFGLIMDCSQQTGLDYNVVRAWIGNKRRKLICQSKLLSVATPRMGGTSPGMAMPGGVADRGSFHVGHMQRMVSHGQSYTARNTETIMDHTYHPGSCSRVPTSSYRPNSARREREQTRLALQKRSNKSQTDGTDETQEVGVNIVNCYQQSIRIYKSKVTFSHETPVISVKNTLSHIQENIEGSKINMIIKQITYNANLSCEPVQACSTASVPLQDHIATAHPSKHYKGSNQLCCRELMRLGHVIKIIVTDYAQLSLVGDMYQQYLKHISRNGNSFSIAMETGDLDEYSREEEMAQSGCQLQDSSPLEHRAQGSTRYQNASKDLPMPRNCVQKSYLIVVRQTPDILPFYYPQSVLMPIRLKIFFKGDLVAYVTVDRYCYNDYYKIIQQLSFFCNQCSYETRTRAALAHITYFTKKKIMQDRTQFSPRDLVMLKRYWDNGMTSLGTVCREKIESVANELNIDFEIVKNWIGNQRRRCRQQGMEPPQPRGGPPDF